ncbi:hypothetical protein ACFXJ8_14740 [Nonomuraea sp. NPDC059194]|uniref:hypothetical protein n=1 Tax=Nonomuraea sp. NPDC059194 TaxID=3346764 RepID=UPI003679FCD8
MAASSSASVAGTWAAVGLFVLALAAQIIAALGFGAWFSYSVPGLYASLDHDPSGPIGILLVQRTFPFRHTLTPGTEATVERP